jgi:hypothetical protein
VKFFYGAVGFEDYRNPGGRTVHRLAPKIVELKAGMFGEAGEHAGAEFVVVVECEHEIGPSWARACAVGAGVALDGPSDALECARTRAALVAGQLMR